jgi:hypothetical protein
MRLLVFLGALAIGGLIVTGAIKMKKSDTAITIQVDRQQVRQEAGRLIEDGKELIDEAETALHDHDASQR